MVTWSATLLALLFNTSAAFAISAQDCTDVRLDGPGGSVEHVFSLSQSAVSCQTHAALVAYDAWRFTNNPQDLRRSSPGASYVDQCKAERISEGTGWAGWPDLTLNFLRNNLPCALKETLKSNDGFSYDPLEKLALSVDKYLYTDKLQGKKLKDSVESCVLKLGIPLDLDKPEYSKTIEAIRAFGELAPFLSTKCPGADRLKALPYEVIYASEAIKVTSRTADEKKNDLNGDQAANLRFMQRGFDEKKEKTQPFMVTYCTYKIEKNAPDYSDDCGGHTVAIIGRRFNEKQKRCEFLFRDSRGITGNDPENPQNRWVDAIAFIKASDEVNQISEVSKNER